MLTNEKRQQSINKERLKFVGNFVVNFVNNWQVIKTVAVNSNLAEFQTNVDRGGHLMYSLKTKKNLKRICSSMTSEFKYQRVVEKLEILDII